MKKTLTINLSGIVFHIDEDAYNVLQQYLSQLESKFKREEESEIMGDIESRIAELFNDKLNDVKTVITLDDVNKAIETLGSPEEIGDEESPKEGESDKKTIKEQKKKHRKFYRDIDNQILGGVAAGLSAYTGIDVAIIRIVLVLLAVFGFGWIIPIYFIMWLVVRPAKTTAQKLEMQGIEPSIENIKNYINSDKFKESAQEIGSTLGNIVKVLFRCTAIVVGVLMGIVGISIIGFILFTLISILIALISGGSFMLSGLLSAFNPGFIANPWMFCIFAILALLVCLIPIISIISATIRLIRNDKTSHKKSWGWTWFIIWLISLVASLVILFSYAPKYINPIIHWNNSVYTDDDLSETSEIRLNGVHFNAIDINAALNVKLVRDSVSFVEVYGLPRDIRRIKTSVNDNTLCLKSTNYYNANNLFNKIIIHYTSIESINLASACSISNLNSHPIVSDVLKIDAAAASVVDLYVKCKHIDVDAASASVITMCGDVDDLEIDLSPAAIANMKELNINKATAKIGSAAVVNGLFSDNLKIDVAPGAVVNQ